MTVLVIAPHPDDECIGCGGTLRLHVRRKGRVVAVFLTSGEIGLKHLRREEAWRIREGEARRAAEILGLAEVVFLRCPDWTLGGNVGKAARLLGPVLEKESPEIIYLPHPADWHPDHKVALPILRAALRHCGLAAPLLRGYEVWTPLSQHDHVENISSVIKIKLLALRAHQSQSKGKFNYERAVTGLNQFRGALAGNVAYAEVFHTASVRGR